MDNSPIHELRPSPRRSDKLTSPSGTTFHALVVDKVGLLYFSEIFNDKHQLHLSGNFLYYHQLDPAAQELISYAEFEKVKRTIITPKALPLTGEDTPVRRYPGKVFAKLIGDEKKTMTRSPGDFKVALSQMLYECGQVFNDKEVSHIFIECFFDALERHMLAFNAQRCLSLEHFTEDFSAILEKVIRDFEGKELRIIGNGYGLFDVAC